MKKLLIYLIILALSTSMLVSPVYGSTAADLKAKEANIEKKYGVDISIEKDITFNNRIYNGTLETIEYVYSCFPEGLIKEVTDYYKKKNIPVSIKIRYFKNVESDLDGLFEATGRNILMTYRLYGKLAMGGSLGEWEVAHDMGHLVLKYLEDKYGSSKFRNKWSSFNGNFSYAGSKEIKGIDTDLYFARYFGGSSLDNDFATIIEQIVLKPHYMRLIVIDKPDSPLAKKMKFMSDVILQCSSTVNKDQPVWGRATPQSPSAWAKDKVNTAFDKGFIPNTSMEYGFESVNFTGLFKSKVTRDDFCTLIVRYLEKNTLMQLSDYVKSKGKNNHWYYGGSIASDGLTVSTSTNYPFSDVEDYDVFDLNALGIFKGMVSTKNFYPHKEITREEAAVILYNAAKLLNTNVKKGSINFVDKSSISNWAIDGVSFAASNNVISDAGNNKFAPKGSITYEQAYIMMLNLFTLDTSKVLASLKEAKFVIQPKYESARSFSEGLALVSVNNKYTYIDKSGKEVIKLPYDKKLCNPHDFHGGVAIIEMHTSDFKNNTLVVINKSGKEVLKVTNVLYFPSQDFSKGLVDLTTFKGDMNNPSSVQHLYIDIKGNKYSYDSVYDFNQGVAIYSKGGKYGLIDKSCNVLLKAEYDSIEYLDGNLLRVKKGDDWGIVDNSGKTLIRPGQYNPLDLNRDSFLVYEGDTYKLISMSGVVLYESKSYIGKFIEGYSVIQVDRTNIVIDTKGKEVFRYTSSHSDLAFNDGLATVNKNSGWYIMDNNFNDVAKIDLNDVIVNNLHDGMATFLNYDNRWGCIDKTGKVIVPAKYEVVQDFFSGHAAIRDGGKYGCIDKTGNIVMEPMYDEIVLGKGIIVVKKDGLYGLYDDTGKEILGVKYKDISLPYIIEGNNLTNFYGFACVTDSKSKKGYYYVDRKGNKFDAFRNGGNGYAIAELENAVKKGSYSVSLYGYYDAEGNQITPIKFNSAMEFDEDIKGMAIAEINDRYGYVDKKGKEVIPLEYNVIGDFSSGLARVTRGSKYGFIDEKGNEVISLIYDEVGDFSEGMAPVSKNGKFGFISFPDK